MAIYKTIITLAFITTATSAFADGYPDYQAQQQNSIDQFQQSVAMQQMQNQINSMDAPSVYVVAPQAEYQPLVRDTAEGTMYVGPGSGFSQ